MSTDTRGHVTGLPSLNAAKIDNVIELTYRGVDSNSLDTNGFGGDSFTLTDKAVSPVSVYDRYLYPLKGELLLFRDNAGFGSRTFSTIGLDNIGGLCLYAAGLRNDALPTSRVADYSLLGDGVGRIEGQGSQAFR